MPDDRRFVLAHTEFDPLLASAVQSELERAGVEFAMRDEGLNPVFGVVPHGQGTEFWVGEDDLALARRLIANALPEPEATEDDALDEPEPADDDPILAPLPAEELPVLFWRGTTSEALVLQGPGATYALLVPEGNEVNRARVDVYGGGWNLVATPSYPGQLGVQGYAGEGEIVLDLEGDDAAALIRSEGGAPLTPLRSADGETWETGDDWVVRLHERSGSKTTRWRVEVDPSVAARPELLLLVTIAAFARRRSRRSGPDWE